MSAIESLNVNSGNLLLQQLSQQQQGLTATQRAAFEQKFEAAAQAAGLDVDKLKSIQGDIQNAISTTIQNYSNPTDKAGLQSAIQKAVDDVLQKNGFDPATVQKQLETARSAMGPGKGHHRGRRHVGQANAQNATPATSGTNQISQPTDPGLMGLLRILEGPQDSQTKQSTQTDQTELAQNLTKNLPGLNILA
jgi:hypothetical protein